MQQAYCAILCGFVWQIAVPSIEMKSKLPFLPRSEPRIQAVGLNFNKTTNRTAGTAKWKGTENEEDACIAQSVFDDNLIRSGSLEERGFAGAHRRRQGGVGSDHGGC
jgi:hypothetical protein